MRNFFLNIVSLLTWTPRAVPEFEWYEESTIGNLFRLWELVAGKPLDVVDGKMYFRIKREGALLQDGKVKSYTLEHFLVHREIMFRRWLEKKLAFRIVPVYLPVTTIGVKIPIGYSFTNIAIDTADTAFDASSGSTGTTETKSYTVTGSNPLLFVGTVSSTGGVDDTTSMTYAGATVAKIGNKSQTGLRTGQSWLKGGAATGANNIVLTKTNGSYSEIYAISYSGSQSSNTADSSATNSAAAATLTTSTTVISTNCWLVGWSNGDGASNFAAGAGTAMHRTATNQGSYDSGGTVGVGSQSLIVTNGSASNMLAVIYSFAPFAVNAIAFDAHSNGGATGASPFSWSHTCTGSNRILFVNAYMGVTDVVTGVTYNSVAMTKIDYIQSGGGDRSSSMWYLLAPATGSNTITITASSGNVTGQAASYTGAKQSGVPDAHGTSSGNTTTPTGSVTVVASNCWLVAGGTANSAISNNTGVVRDSVSSGGSGYIGDSSGTVGTGSQTINFTQSSNWWGQDTASFAPFVAATTTGILMQAMAGL